MKEYELAGFSKIAFYFQPFIEAKQPGMNSSGFLTTVSIIC